MEGVAGRVRERGRGAIGREAGGRWEREGRASRHGPEICAGKRFL